MLTARNSAAKTAKFDFQIVFNGTFLGRPTGTLHDHILPHSHYPSCRQGLSAERTITTANALWAHQRALHLQGHASAYKRALGHVNSSVPLIKSLGLPCSNGKNANRAISHNLTLGYIIGYDKYRNLSPQTQRGLLDIIRDCSSSGECYDYVVLA